MDTVRRNVDSAVEHERFFADCDAFSFILTFQPDFDDITKRELQNFFYFFGSPVSEVAIASSPVAMSTYSQKGNDQIFGSGFVLNERLGDALEKSEILITSSPIKIAVHSSCKAEIINAVDKGRFHLKPAVKQGITFTPSPNSPTYLNIVNAILSKATIVTLQSGQRVHVIHVANIGTRHPIDEISRQKCGLPMSECTMRKVFALVKKLRDVGVTAELTQIDIAVNIPVSEEKLPQWSISSNATTTGTHIFGSGSSVDVWSIHDVVGSSGENETIHHKDQKGTFRIRQQNWEEERKISVLGENIDVNNFSSSTPRSMNIIRDIYTQHTDAMEDDSKPTNTTMEIDTKSIYSCKCYSDIAHHLTNEKWKYPLTNQASNALPFKNMLYLQRLTRDIAELLESSLTSVSANGVNGRVEISIRPTNNDLLLRSNGHFTDIMTYALLGLIDSFEGKHTVQLHEDLSYDIVSIQCTKIIQSIQQVISFRAQRKFNEVYREIQMQQWLKAMFFLATTLMGLTHQGKMQIINSWLRSSPENSTFYDPLQIKRTLMVGTSLYEINSEEHNEDPSLALNQEEIQEHIISTSQEILLSRMSPEGKEIFIQFINNSISSHRTYIKLPLYDKHLLAAHLTQDLIPGIAQVMSRHQQADDYADSHLIQQVEEEIDIQSNNEQHPNDDKIETPDAHTVWTPTTVSNYVDPDAAISTSLKESFTRLYQDDFYSHGKTNLLFQSPESNHPVVKVISRLSELAQQFDINTPLFFGRFKNFISEFHKRILGDTTMSQFLPQCRNTSRDLKLLHQKIFEVGTPQTKAEIIQKICMHYLIPCQGSVLSNKDDRWISIEQRGDLPKISQILFNTVTTLSSVEILSTNCDTRRFYRSLDALSIHIPKPTTLYQCTNINAVKFENHSPQYRNPQTMIYRAIYGREEQTPDADAATVMQEMISNSLRQIDDISNTFLSPEANNNVRFGNCADFNELSRFAQGELFLTEHFSTYHHILLPVISLITKQNVVYYDFHHQRFYYHFFDKSNSKVISYEEREEHNQIQTRHYPLGECFIFCSAYIEQIGYVYKFADVIVNTTNTMESSNPISSRISNVSPFSTSMIQHVTKFPNGTPSNILRSPKTNLIENAILKTLLSTEVRHPHFHLQQRDDDDILDINAFMEDIFSMYNSIEDFFEESICADFVKTEWYDGTLHSIMLFLRESDSKDTTMFVKTVTVIVCLKYKLWFGIWFENSNSRIKKSEFYWFDSRSKKVAKVSYNTFTFHKTINHVMYFKAKHNDSDVISSITRWNLPIHNPYNPGIQLTVPFNQLKFLVYRFSYIECYTYNDLLEKIRITYNADITDLDHDFLVSEIRPTLIDFKIDVGKDEQPTMIQNVLAIVYHYSMSPDSKFQIHWIHHSAPSEMLKIGSKCIMERIFQAGHVRRDYCITHTPCLQEYDGTEQISPRFMNILHACLAAIFPSPSLFNHSTSRLRNIENLNQKIKEWVSNAAVDKSRLEKQYLPYWLQNIVIAIEIQNQNPINYI